MKVLLVKDVKSQGKAGDIINVSDGYARNFLIPNGLAKMANAENINAAKIKAGAEIHKKEVEKQEAVAKANDMEGLVLNMAVKCGENGRIFGAVTAKEISAELKKQKNIDVDKKKLVLKENIKDVGEYTVQVKLYANVSANIKVIIKAEK